MPRTPKRQNEYDRVHWRTLAAKVGSSGCASNAAYATFVSGEGYLPGSICLRRSLLKAGNRCPVDLVYDDRSPLLNLSAQSWDILSDVYGAERLIPLSRLMALHPQSAADMRYSLVQGRRLYHRGVEHYATHSKLWLWALPRSRLLLLDADMVVLGQLDWLTSLEVKEQVAAIDISNRNTDAPRFNSGLMILKPAAELVRNLTRLAINARSPRTPEEAVPKVNEKYFGDQSIVNWYFRKSWLALPPSLAHTVHPRMKADAKKIAKQDVAVLHWMGEPKPWSRNADLRLESSFLDAGNAKLASGVTPSDQAALWWRYCGEHMQGVPRAWLG